MTALWLNENKILLGRQKMQQNKYVAYMEVHVYNKCLNLPPLKPTPNNQRLSNSNDGPVIEWEQDPLGEAEDATE